MCSFSVVRVLEIVEKNESVSWKLEYELPSGDGPKKIPCSNSKRKLSPTSPVVLRKYLGKDGGVMTRSLDRSMSFTPGMLENGAMLARQNLLLRRSNSVRKKPSFETLSESSTESEFDDFKKNFDEVNQKQPGEDNEMSENVDTPETE